MPLPNPGVLNDILDLYFNKKSNDETQSTVQSFKRFAGNISSLVTFTDPYQKKIQQAHSSFKLEFSSAKSVQDWIKIIHNLADAANSAQTEKKLSGRSDACDIYHMARTYIVKTLTSENDKVMTDFNNEIKELIQKRNKLDEDIKYKRQHTKSIAVKSNKEELESTLTKLAYLGDEDSMFRAIDRRLFSHLSVLNSNEKIELMNLDKDTFEELNDEIPYCLQSKFYKMYYREVFQKILTYSFSEFESKAIIKFQSNLHSEKERKEKLLLEEKHTQEVTQKRVNEIENQPTLTSRTSFQDIPSPKAEIDDNNPFGSTEVNLSSSQHSVFGRQNSVSSSSSVEIVSPEKLSTSPSNTG